MSRNESAAATTASRADVVREHYTKVCHCEWSEDEFTRTTTSKNCSIHGNVPDPLDALVAEIGRLREALTYYAEGRYPDGGETAREALGDA